MGREEGGTAGEWQLLVILGSAATLSALAWASFPGIGERRGGASCSPCWRCTTSSCARSSSATARAGASFAVLILVALAIPGRRGAGR